MQKIVFIGTPKLSLHVKLEKCTYKTYTFKDL